MIYLHKQLGMLGISAHFNGPSIVKSGKYRGLTLKQLWDKHRGLFGNYKAEQFPLLTKILDAKRFICTSTS